MDWNTVLKLPQPALLPPKKIDKTVLVAQGALTKKQQKLLDSVERVTLFASVQKSTTHVNNYRDETYQLESFPILKCELRGTSNSTDLIEILHGLFPNPTMLLIEVGEFIAVSVALTRKSIAEHGVMVVDEQATSRYFELGEQIYQDFIQALGFDCAPQENLLEFVKHYIRLIRLSRYVKTLGFYPVVPKGNEQVFFEMIRQYESCSQEIARIQGERQGAPLRIAAKLRVSLDDAEKQQLELSNRIKEYCNA